MSPVIEVAQLTKVFRPAKGIARWLSASPIQHEIRVLDGVDLKVHRGEVFALLGPNGAGKTTLLKVLATLLRPDAGSVRIAGFDVVAEERKVGKKSVGSTPMNGVFTGASAAGRTSASSAGCGT